MELMKQDIHMDCRKCRASMQIALEDDVNISDSRPDAAKLILDRGNVVVSEIKVTEDHVNVKGALEFHILYLSDQVQEESGRGELAQMEGKIPFEENIFMEGVTGTDTVNVVWEIEDLSTGLINSRKLSVQALVNLELYCEEVRDEEIAVDLCSQEPVEFRKRNLQVASTKVCKKDLFRIKEEVEIPGSFPNILSLIWTEITLGTIEYKVLEDKISIQGELRAFFVYRAEGEEEICHYETTLPFSGSLECEGCREGMVPEICCVSQSREVEVRPDFDGEERVITFEQCLELSICVYEEESIDILSDVYGVLKEVSVKERNADFMRLLQRCSGKTKLSGHFEEESEKTVIHKILHTGNTLVLQEKKQVENGIEITGVLELQVFYECSSEGDRYGVIRCSLPFQYLLETEGLSGECEYPVMACVDQITVAIIDSREIDVKAVLYFKANVYQKWQERIVEQIQVQPADMEKMAALPGIAVYMVRDGESLWDIGKRYYVPVSALRQTNGLSEDEVKAGDKILIVRGF